MDAKKELVVLNRERNTLNENIDKLNQVKKEYNS